MEKRVRYNSKAWKIGQKLFGEIASKRLAMLEELDPEFCQLFQQFVYGGMYSRSILSTKMRELCAVAALTVLNRLPQLESHIRAALRAKASRKEILEVILQMSVYGGFPVTLSALELLKRVYTSLDAPQKRDI